MSIELDIPIFRPGRPGIRKVLGDLEAEIMELMWAHSTEVGLTVRDIFAILYTRRQIAYTTVMSTMARLAKKNLLRVETPGQTYIYTPTMTRSEFIACMVGHILEGLFVSFADETLEGLDTLADQDIAATVRAFLEEITHRRTREQRQDAYSG